MGLEKVVKNEVSICIDNAEVLSRGRRKEVGTNLKDHGVLDYDLWKEMIMLQRKIKIPIKWDTVDSHIENRVYREGKGPEGNKFSLHLNKVVDEWAGKQMEPVKNKEGTIRNTQIWYESQIMV